MKCGGVVLEGVVVTAYGESGSYSDIEGGKAMRISIEVKEIVKNEVKVVKKSK